VSPVPAAGATSLSKDYKMVLNRYVPNNGPKTITGLTDNEIDRKYGQILTRYQTLDSLALPSTYRVTW